MIPRTIAALIALTLCCQRYSSWSFVKGWGRRWGHYFVLIILFGNQRAWTIRATDRQWVSNQKDLFGRDR